MAKTKVVQKNTYIRVSETVQYSAEIPKIGLLCHILILFYLLVQKDLQWKQFHK